VPLHSVKVVVWCAANVWQIIGLNTFQQTVNSDWYVDDILDNLRTSKCVTKLDYMLQGMLKGRREPVLVIHIKYSKFWLPILQ
jgi:hypothetical protein